MRIRLRDVLAAVVLVGLVACAGPQPILQSNQQRLIYGKEAADRAIAECLQMADTAGVEHGISRMGHIGTGATLGAIIGAATGASTGLIGGGAGVAIGAAAGGGVGAVLGGLAGAFKAVTPERPYAVFVARCLKEKGYEVESWE